MRIVSYILCAALLSVATAFPVHAGTDVDITAADGFTLKGTFYDAGGPSPGVLLLHQCNQERTSYEQLATALAKKRIHVLTFDFRGYGESVDPSIGEFTRETLEANTAHWESDVAAALEVLTSQAGVDKQRLGALGASCGGSQALLLAESTGMIRTLTFLSSSLPWIEEGFAETTTALKKLSVLSIAADGDVGTAEVTRDIHSWAKHKRSRLIMYKGDLHGTPLLEHDPSLEGTIVQWFLNELEGRKGSYR